VAGGEPGSSASEHRRIEEAIRGGESRYRSLVENAHDVLWVFDLDLGYTYISPSVRRLLGYSVEETKKRSLDQLLTPESAQKARDLFAKERLLEVTGHPHGPDWSLTTDFELIHKDGATFWAETTMNPFSDEAGRVKGIMGITRDITQRKKIEEDLKRHRDSLEDVVKARTADLLRSNEELKTEILERRRAEEALREMTEKFHIHFALANDVMFSYDNQFRVLSVTPNVERVLGYKPEDFIGKTFQEAGVLHPDSMDSAFRNALHILSGEPVYSSIYKFISRDRRTLYGEVSGVPCMRNGCVYAVTTIARDITQRVEMTAAIQESEERYCVTLQGVPDAVSIMRASDCEYLYVNDAFSRILGYSPDEAKGKTPFDLNLPVSADALDLCMHLARNNEPLESMECQFRTRHGTVIDTLLSARPVHYDGQDCVITVIKDITVLRQMMEERKRVEFQSGKMESIGTLASGIAHDFNNILTSIIGYTRMSMKDIQRLAQGEKDVEAVRSDLEEVGKAARRAQDLVNHILAFSRHGEKAYSTVDLASTFSDSLKVLRTTLPSNVKVREDLDQGCMISGDPALLHQVITNLCTNAAHAMDRTGGDLEVDLRRVRVKGAELEPEVAPGNYIRLSVKDTGPGMSSTVMARIFDPYFTTRSKSHGTGLGLSIVHGIVKSHGGAIICRSAPGKGTSFEVYFPEYAHEHEATEAGASRTGLVEDRRILDLDEGMSGTGTTGKPGKNRGVHHRQDVPGK